MRSIRGIVALLPLLFCGCGGGGGGGGGGGTPDRDAAQTLLEDCGVDAINSFLEAFDVGVSIIDPAATSLPAIQVEAVDQMQGSIAWNANLTGDPAPELLGSLQFTNDQGQPAEPPFDLTQFMGGDLSTLDQFLDQLPDGWTVTITANSLLQPLVNTTFRFVYTSGAVSDVGGNGDVADAMSGCSASFLLQSAALSDVSGTFPDTAFKSTYAGGGTTFGGNTTFDGTDVPAVDGTVNSGTKTYTFDVDLGTGTVTPR
jgi:hypothetical protein